MLCFNIEIKEPWRLFHRWNKSRAPAREDGVAPAKKKELLITWIKENRKTSNKKKESMHEKIKEQKE